MPQIYGVDIPDEVVDIPIEDFMARLTNRIGGSQIVRFLQDMVTAGAPSLTQMLSAVTDWTRRPDLFRYGANVHRGLRVPDDANQALTPDRIDSMRQLVELSDRAWSQLTGPDLRQYQPSRSLAENHFFAGDSLTYTPIHNNKPEPIMTWDHNDMVNLLKESVPPQTAISPRRTGQEVSINMNSTYGKGILCHITQYGELFLHNAFRVKKRIRGQFKLCNVYQALKEAFTIDLYLKKEEPYLINLLDTPAMILDFRATTVQGETYYMSGQGSGGFTDGRDIEISMTIAPGSVIATGMEDLYSIVSKRITVAQPERKVDFGVIQGRLGR